MANDPPRNNRNRDFHRIPDKASDKPGGCGKIPVGPAYLSQQRDGEGMQPRRLVDYCGDVHSYPLA